MNDNTLRVPHCALALVAVTFCCGSTALADAPVFSSSSYSFAVSLDQQSQYAGTVSATDPEFDPFVYVLHDTSGMFSIESNHGYIFADLDNLEPGTYTMEVEAVDIFSESSFADVEIVVTAAPPPVIVGCGVYDMGGGMWWISGTVDSSTPSGTVKFGGVLAGRATTYDSVGQFQLMTTYYGAGGQAWMQAIDEDGQESDVRFFQIGN